MYVYIFLCDIQLCQKCPLHCIGALNISDLVTKINTELTIGKLPTNIK
jgi:hypothetical protein